MSLTTRQLSWLVILLAPLRASADASVTLCDSGTGGAQRRWIGAELRRWVPGLRVKPAAAPSCKRRRPAAGGYVAWFARRRGRVVLVVRGHGGVSHARLVPWIRQPGAALAALRAEGRLPQLSVLIQGLLVEHRLGGLGGARVRKHRKKRRRPRRKRVAPASAPVVIVEAPASQPAEPPVPAEPYRPAPSKDGELPPDLRDTFYARRPGGLLADLTARLDVTSRWREADVWSLEIGAKVGWRSLYLGAGYLVPAPWSFEGRLIEVWAVDLHAGWRPALWRGGGYTVRPFLGLVAEWVVLRRVDVRGATEHGYWDLGAVAGVGVTRRISRLLELGVGAAIIYFPAGNEVAVPGGPAARFNRFGVQFGLFTTFGQEARGLF